MKTSAKLRKLFDANQASKICVHSCRTGHVCDSRPTLEHALVYRGRQINELFAIVPACRGTNIDVVGEDKDFGRWVALLRLERNFCDDYRIGIARNYPKIDFEDLRRRIEANRGFVLGTLPGLQHWLSLDLRFLMHLPGIGR